MRFVLLLFLVSNSHSCEELTQSKAIVFKLYLTDSTTATTLYASSQRERDLRIVATSTVLKETVAQSIPTDGHRYDKDKDEVQITRCDNRIN